jgi:hypothetical protein
MEGVWEPCLGFGKDLKPGVWKLGVSLLTPLFLPLKFLVVG